VCCFLAASAHTGEHGVDEYPDISGITTARVGDIGSSSLNDATNYRGADKSLARPGRKQATVTKLSLLQATQKKFRRLYVQPGLRGSSDLRFRRKMATFQLFFQLGRAKDLSCCKITDLFFTKCCLFQNFMISVQIICFS